jgi:hypothetical protein
MTGHLIVLGLISLLVVAVVRAIQKTCVYCGIGLHQRYPVAHWRTQVRCMCKCGCKA